jgi:putative MATE family efflux protein
LVIPILLSTFTQIFLSVQDTAFIGRISSNALAAVGSATTLFDIVIQILGAAAIGYQIMVIWAFGKKDLDEVNDLFAQAALLISLLTTVGFVILWFSTPFLRVITNDPQVISDGELYLRFRAPSLFFSGVATLLTMTMTANRQSKWVFYDTLIISALDFVLNIIFIFGFGPIPAMGIAGAALSSTVSRGTGLLFLLIVNQRYSFIQFGKLRFRLTKIWKMLQLSSYEILNALLDYGGNFVFFSFMGALGTIPLAGGRLGFNLLFICFSVTLSFGIGVQIMMGQNKGAGNIDEMVSFLRAGRSLNLIISCIIGVPLIIFPYAFASIFTNQPSVLDVAYPTVIIIGIAMPLMAYTTTHVGALRAVGATRQVMIINSVCVWLVQLPLGWLIGTQLGFGLAGVFSAYIGYFIIRSLWSIYAFGQSLHKLTLSAPT